VRSALPFFFLKGEGTAKMADKKCKGTPLKVFSGKQAKLNRIILLLIKQDALTKYETFLAVRRIKGFRHKTSGTVGRRMDALSKEAYIVKIGTRPSKIEGECDLYAITKKGKSALRLDNKSGDKFLDTANDEEFDNFLANY
jgi:DNA-binding PadR family transcriptional regulator